MLSTFAEHPTLIGSVQLEHWPILALSTLPLLAVSIYVLYDVHYRTTYNASRGNIDDDDGVRQDYAGVSLTVLLYLFLLAFVALSTLLAYYGHFMAKRLELLERYTKTGYIVNGNHHPKARLGWWRLLDYIQCRFVGRYDRLVYAHPSPSAAGLVGMPASAHGSTARGNQEGWVVKKLIRRSRAVMDRQRQLHGGDAKGVTSGANESIPIVILPDCPQSGMLQDDVEYDAAFLSHFRSSKRYKETLLVIGFWITFTLLSAIYLVLKMGGANATRDSMPNGIAALLTIVFVITPAVAYGYSWLRWARHKQFVTNSGKARQGRIMNELPLSTDSEEEIEMGQVCGSGYYSQML
mmetsp:Transcript_26753/g.77138  ORF Transcript_26753/g.77138 Transcript_26753/m.77138 type:complete len:351 (+) Transcript_26753:44-1096(+)